MLASSASMPEQDTAPAPVSAAQEGEIRIIGELQWKIETKENSSKHAEISVSDATNQTSLEQPNGSAFDTINNNNSDVATAIPESALQYERQLRKSQAESRSNNPNLSVEEHLHIVYEDDALIVANKPSGVLCVPGLYDKPNLLGLVRDYLIGGESGIELPEPSRMIVHRLDMDTSGLVVFAKTTVALQRLHDAFRDRKVDKEYHALLCGHLAASEAIDGMEDHDDADATQLDTANIHLPLQRDHEHPPFMRVATTRSEEAAQQALEALHTRGWKKLVKKKPKPSHTHLTVQHRGYYDDEQQSGGVETVDANAKHSGSNENDSSLRLAVTRVSLVPHTGRTHQLRVHCAALGYPIVGDPAYGVYGEANPCGGLDSAHSGGASLDLQQSINARHSNAATSSYSCMCLHAARLSLSHPMTGERMDWTAVAPF